jgi:hypothetical protein
MNGAVISWGIFDAPPAGPEALTHTELATRSPHLLHFQEEDRGKTVYISLQWQNESGIRGDPTEMQADCAVTGEGEFNEEVTQSTQSIRKGREGLISLCGLCVFPLRPLR